MKKQKPVVLMIDDDVDFIKIASAMLSQLDVDSHSATTADEFILKLKSLSPDLCLIDLNLDGKLAGFPLIRAIRAKFGYSIPLIVVSGKTDPQTIAHAIEIGASDYITKPLIRDILATKLAPFIKTEIIEEKKREYIDLPTDQGVKVRLDVPLEIDTVDEFGFTLISDHLLTKSSVVHLSGELFTQISGFSEPQLMKVSKTWVIDNGTVLNRRYGAYVEFDDPSEAILVNVRKWISKKLR